MSFTRKVRPFHMRDGSWAASNVFCHRYGESWSPPNNSTTIRCVTTFRSEPFLCLGPWQKLWPPPRLRVVITTCHFSSWWDLLSTFAPWNSYPSTQPTFTSIGGPIPWSWPWQRPRRHEIMLRQWLCSTPDWQKFWCSCFSTWRLAQSGATPQGDSGCVLVQS